MSEYSYNANVEEFGVTGDERGGVMTKFMSAEGVPYKVLDEPIDADGEQGGDLFPQLNEARATISRLNDTRALELRIEALRAAAQVMGQAQNPTWRGDSSITLALARDFVEWLETGE